MKLTPTVARPALFAGRGNPEILSNNTIALKNLFYKFTLKMWDGLRNYHAMTNPPYNLIIHQ